ncbi:MAG: hypothetical protein J5I93_14425 [Pirellulaceae bacterium]|nr:hypothetical protein [Pirellulaceae bacterium]
MTLPDLLTELERADIRIEAHGDRLYIDAPRGALTPDLLGRLRRHKPELLDVLTSPAPADAAEGQAHGDDLTDDVDLPEAPPPGSDGWPEGCIDPATLQPCSICGRLELWQSLAGTWQCLRCGPPVVARRIREVAERLRAD